MEDRDSVAAKDRDETPTLCWACGDCVPDGSGFTVWVEDPLSKAESVEVSCSRCFKADCEAARAAEEAFISLETIRGSAEPGEDEASASKGIK